MTVENALSDLFFSWEGLTIGKSNPHFYEKDETTKRAGEFLELFANAATVAFVQGRKQPLRADELTLPTREELAEDFLSRL